jgi:hypothetical protein
MLFSKNRPFLLDNHYATQGKVKKWQVCHLTTLNTGWREVSRNT